MLRGNLTAVFLLGLAAVLMSIGCETGGNLANQGQAATRPSDTYPYTHDAGHCKVCGAPLFEALPHATSRQEIIAFAKSSKAFRNDKDALNGWIHPGIYCPNGCTEILINVEGPTKEPGSGK